jgi:hypothetical protein
MVSAGNPAALRRDDAPGPAGAFFGEEGLDDVGRYPALGAGGRDQFGAQRPRMGHFQGAHQGFEISRQPRRGCGGSDRVHRALCRVRQGLAADRGPDASALGQGRGLIRGVHGGAANVGVQDRGQVRVRETAVKCRAAQGPVDLVVSGDLGQGDGLGPFRTFLRAVPAAAASSSQVLAPRRLASLGTKSALASYTDASTPPLVARSAR